MGLTPGYWQTFFARDSWSLNCDQLLILMPGINLVCCFIVQRKRRIFRENVQCNIDGETAYHTPIYTECLQIALCKSG